MKTDPARTGSASDSHSAARAGSADPALEILLLPELFAHAPQFGRDLLDLLQRPALHIAAALPLAAPAPAEPAPAEAAATETAPLAPAALRRGRGLGRRLERLDAQRDTPVLRVDLQDLDLDDLVGL